MTSTLVTIEIVTRDAIALFYTTNTFLKNLDMEYKLQSSLYVPSAPAIVSLKEAVTFGVAATLIKNPEITRRFWSGWNNANGY